MASHLYLSLGWIAYCILHSVLAHNGIKNGLRKVLGSGYRFYRLFYSLLAIILLIPLVIWLIRIPSPLLFLPGPLTGIPAALLTAAGLWGVMVSLKKYITSPGGFRDLFFEGKTPVLLVRGLHRVVRHPLYLSTFLFIAGLLLFFPYLSFLLVSLIIVLYTLAAIPLEEKKLVDLYGDAYRRYKKEVPAILPRF